MKNPLQKTISMLICFVLFTQLYAQTGQVKGTVSDGKEALPFTTVVLKSAVDSAMVKAEVSSADGSFTFYNIAFAKYFLMVSYVGMESFSSDEFELNQNSFSVPTIVLQAISTEIAEVQVVAQRQLIEVLSDKTVFNVENTLNATGTNGLELLRKAPGVILDNNNNVIVEGKTGVLIYIDGKASPLAGEDLTNYLSALQSSDINKIEIITQPSSRYDAAGNAGIINIVLKRDKNLGTNGTIGIGYAYGKNGRPNSSLSINNRTKRVNAFGSYSNSFGDSEDFLYLDRTQGNTRYDSKTTTIRNSKSNNIRAGVDYFPKDNHTFGILLNGNFYNRKQNGETITPIIPVSSGEVEQILQANNVVSSESNNLSGNLNYRFADTLGHELLADLDYGRYNSDRTNYQPNRYVNANGETQISEANFRMITPTNIDVLTAKLDYSQNLKKGKLSLGGKYSLVETDNTFDFYNVVASGDVLNEDRSNQFEYKENINALYANYNIKITKWDIQAGLRMEQTISEGNLISNQMSAANNVKRNYYDWFPSGGLTYTPDYKNSWALTYSRRIQRPNYSALNPFEYQLDELSFSKGNPFLQPQYTHNIRLAHTYKYRFTTSLSYSRINDYFANVTETLGETRNFLITRNVANQEVWYLNISLPFDVNKWWNVYASIGAYHSAFEGNDDKFVSIDQATFSSYMQHTFKLTKGLRFEVSGWFSSPSIWGGTYQTKSMGSLDVGLQKKFMDDRLSVRLSGSDILFTSFWRADVQFGDLYIDGSGGGESRQIRLNLSYNFGRSEVKGSRNRKMGLEEEGKRIN